MYSPFTFLIKFNSSLACGSIGKRNQKSSVSLIRCSASPISCSLSILVKWSTFIRRAHSPKKSANTPSMSTYISDADAISPNCSCILVKYTLLSVSLSTVSVNNVGFFCPQRLNNTPASELASFSSTLPSDPSSSLPSTLSCL